MSGKPGFAPRTRGLGLIIRGDERTLLELLEELKRWPALRVIYSRLSTSKMLIQEVPWGPVSSMPEVRTEPVDNDDETDEDKDIRHGSLGGRRR